MSHVDLDHVGVATRNLDAIQSLYTRLGFQLTTRSLHSGAVRPGGPVEPWASGNHCAMFRKGYLELLGLVSEGGHSTVGAYIERYEGAHIVAFGGCATAELMCARLRNSDVEANIRTLERDAAFGVAAAETRRARFSNVYVDAQAYPEARFIFIEHHTPAVLWQEHLLEHPNGVVALREVGFASDDLPTTTRRLERLLGAVARVECADASVFELPHTAVHVLATAEWSRRLPAAVVPPTPAPVWIGFTVESVVKTRHFLASADVPVITEADALWVLPQDAGGVALKFSEVA